MSVCSKAGVPFLCVESLIPLWRVLFWEFDCRYFPLPGFTEKSLTGCAASWNAGAIVGVCIHTRSHVNGWRDSIYVARHNIVTTPSLLSSKYRHGVLTHHLASALVSERLLISEGGGSM
jgi:hypothetical protein